MDDQDYKSLILYYGREKFFYTMQNRSLEALGKFPSLACFRLYNGFALVLGNRVQEGIRELHPLQSDYELGMATLLALIYAHKRCTVIDKEALIAFDSRLKEERKKLTTASAYYSGVFLLLSGKFDKAKEYAEKALKLNRSSFDAMVLKGWAELTLNTKVNKTTLELFTKALVSKNLDASFGQIKYHQLNNDFETAITMLNQLSVRYPDLNAPLVEKMKTQLASWNWEQALESSARILNIEPSNIEALRIKLLVFICRDGNYNAAATGLHYLFSSMSKVEPSSSELYLQMAQLFARVCGRDREILDCTMMFAEKAAQMSPHNSDYLAEVGYQLILNGKHKDAVKYFRSATKVDDSSLGSLCGLTLCQMAESPSSEQVMQQIEFLNEIQGTAKNPLLLYMSSRTIADNPDKSIALLIQACEVQFKNLKTLPFGIDYLRHFDPDFLLQIIKELLQFSPIQSTVTVTVGQTISKETLHISLKHSLNILEAIVKACPGLVQAVYQLAKVEYLCGEISSSAVTLQKILQEINPTYTTDAHLLIAQIHIQQEHYQRASQSLEICLSHNFHVRDNPMYHLLNGIIKKSQAQYEEALKNFNTAMSISGLNKQSPNKMGIDNVNSLILADRVTLYLNMIEVYILTGQHVEASKLMDTAFTEFSNTPEEGRLIIANADLALQQANISKVLDMLTGIQPGQPYYLQAKTKLAHVYLNHKKDRLAFAQCFRELVDNCPGADSYLMLGDAYMSIQEPDEAIDAFKRALNENPNDPLLASKLGRAYVKTHQYTKAITYYQEATLNAFNAPLKLDLAELFLKLNQFSNAEQTLIDEIDSKNLENEDTTLLQTRTKQLLLLARIREKSGHLNSSLATLREARDNQYRLQNRITVEQSGGLQEQHNVLSKICISMAEQSISLRDNTQAIQHYKEALKFSPDDIKVMAALARIYMQSNELNDCEDICSRILKNDSSNEISLVIMADISFRKMEFANAANHFSQLLTNKPTYWTALARLIEVLRRSAKIEETESFIQRGEQNCQRPHEDPGLNFCKGLYEWYTGNPNSALRYFNSARRDPEWGQQAIFNMVEICLNPDGDLPNDNLQDSADDVDLRESRSMALRTADRLLRELKPKAGGMDNEALNFRLIKAFLNLATRIKYNVELALLDFTNLAQQIEYKDHVGPILGIATANVMLKQGQRAKNQLKRVARSNWTFEDAEYLERSWLILADIYIQSGKYDMATDLLDRVIGHNKSCVKAYELGGYIAEKEQSNRLAAVKYDLAWRYGGKSKVTIAYKLAFNHMKTKRYADAIDVCQQVLKLYPEYVVIKKDILDKCRNNLKI